MAMSKCSKCKYEDLSGLKEPCCECKNNIDPSILKWLKAKDCYVPKYESSNCTISCKEGNENFTNGDYGFKEISKDEVDMVNHPQHYSAHGIEPIDYIESHNLNFNLGNVIKYVSRAPFKGTELEDLQKAKWYLEREIKKHDNYRND